MAVMAVASARYELPVASVVVACRNERSHIAPCLDSLVRGQYPLDRLDIVVVDGMSSDGTREIVREYSTRFPCVQLVDNPRLVTPVAFNAGIRAARGEVVAIVGAHATYDPSYLLELVRHLLDYGADEVGAVATYLPRRDTVLSRAIVVALSHPFGAGANAAYKIGATKPQWVDTVSSGCYRRDVFDRIGFFDERLLHSQDIEFNGRLRRAGGKILLVPSARITYYARSELRDFLAHTFRNGLWVILPLLQTSESGMSWRHFVPVVFVLALLCGSVSWPLLGTLPILLVTIPYVMASALASVGVVFRRLQPEYLLTLPPVFAALHLTYGLGSLWGIVRYALPAAARRLAPGFASRTRSGPEGL